MSDLIKAGQLRAWCYNASASSSTSSYFIVIDVYSVGSYGTPVADIFESDTIFRGMPITGLIEASEHVQDL
jgi:hypothetical protein